jgi:hypothetical protein
MTENERLILQMKRSAGLASADEIAVLAAQWRYIGGGEGATGVLAVPTPCATEAEWEAKYGGLTPPPFIKAGGTLAGAAPADFAEVPSHE